MLANSPRPRNAIVANSGNRTSTPIGPNDTLYAAVRLIRQRYEAVQTSTDDGQAGRRLTDNLIGLRLAEAALEKSALDRRLPSRPLQIAVIGPTQSGKSSIVNVVLGTSKARVSPLAGYTVHSQGFPLNTKAAELDWLDGYFAGYQRSTVEGLPGGRYGFFGLGEETVEPTHPLQSAVIWDTPDFDSVDAVDYRNAVLRTAALADVILLVVSKDKYADQSVWEIMGLLESLAQPTVVCLNKLNPGSADTLSRSLREKWRSARADEPLQIFVLPWIEDGEGLFPAQLDAQLQVLLVKAGGQIDRSRSAAQARQLVAAHWNEWLVPIRQELSARAEWNEMVESSFKEALTIYRRDFLDTPQTFETFQLALAELLTLLEIPGLAGGIAAARKLLTWPVRQLSRWGKRIGNSPNLGQETAVLNRTLEHLFIHLGQGLVDKSADDSLLAGFWRELGGVLREERKLGETQRASALARHVLDFQPEIERTARQLHEKLREHPGVLNTLRATRVTADAAALGLALHTGGIGLQDFIIAPAILSVTSLMTESALGRYLHKAEEDLKERQFKEVEKLFRESLKPVLDRLPDRLKGQGRFNISLEMVDAAEKLLYSSLSIEG